ncbi:MAG: T9SS type A sorting domain-containing protein [Candidatus Eisenbacteria bacterium]|nr:T9SS type A sorting domain-containing protein [Candidatus Eisenbacteria bacterium]
MAVALATTLLACATCIPPALADFPPDYTQGEYLFILTSESDYTGGNYALMDRHAPWAHDDNLGQMCSDAVARARDGLIYVINRWGGDNIQVIDPQQSFDTILQFSTGAGSNPQDICFVDDHRAFVTRYEESDLWEVDPTTGEPTAVIDLSPLADADGIPEMLGMAIQEDRLFVGLQRLDRDYYWIPVPPSYLAVIDLADNSLIDMDLESPGMQGIALSSLCPNSWIVTDPLTGDLLVGQVGAYGVADGGIERIDPRTGESRGMAVTEAALGGDLNVWSTHDGMRAYAIVIGTDYSTKVEAFDLQTGASRGTVTSASEYAFSHLWVDLARAQLFVCDRSYADPGIRIFDLRDHTPLVPQPISVGLYPFWLCGMEGADAGLEDGAGPHASEPRLALFPQPAAGGATLCCTLSDGGEARLEILDLQGRTIDRFRTTGAGGVWEVRWRPSDQQGLPSGVYWARLRHGSGTEVRKFQYLRH